MSYFPGMQKGNLDTVKPDAHGKIKKETVVLQGVSVTRVTFDVGARWSNDLKEYAGTESCRLPHVALVLSGTLRVVMDEAPLVRIFEPVCDLLGNGQGFIRWHWSAFTGTLGYPCRRAGQAPHLQSTPRCPPPRLGPGRIAGLQRPGGGSVAEFSLRLSVDPHLASSVT